MDPRYTAKYYMSSYSEPVALQPRPPALVAGLAPLVAREVEVCSHEPASVPLLKAVAAALEQAACAAVSCLSGGLLIKLLCGPPLLLFVIQLCLRCFTNGPSSPISPAQTLLCLFCCAILSKSSSAADGSHLLRQLLATKTVLYDLLPPHLAQQLEAEQQQEQEEEEQRMAAALRRRSNSMERPSLDACFAVAVDAISSSPVPSPIASCARSASGLKLQKHSSLSSHSRSAHTSPTRRKWSLDVGSHSPVPGYQPVLQPAEQEQLMRRSLDAAQQGGRDSSYMQRHEAVSVCFADIVGYTTLVSQMQPIDAMKLLNNLFFRLDVLAKAMGVYKVETIGDSYMSATGLQGDDPTHAERMLRFAAAMLQEAAQVAVPGSSKPLLLRVGIHTGPATSGLTGMIGRRYCMFGDTVNVASRMESTASASCIQISSDTYALVRHVPGFSWVRRLTPIKGKGTLLTYICCPHGELPSACVPKRNVRRVRTDYQLGGGQGAREWQ